MFRTSNPVLSSRVFSQPATGTAGVMTLTGTINASLIFLALLLIAAMTTWKTIVTHPGQASLWITGGAIAGLVLVFVTMFKPQWSAVTGSLYALAEGLVLGGISAIYEAQFQGIVLQAVLLTASVLLVMLASYRMGWVRATERFRTGVMAATGGILLVYLATMILGFFGIQIPMIHDSGWVGIGFSLFVVGIAALNLVMDFDFIERGCAAGAPKYMEWYGAFGLLVTLVWLYIEILRLLSKLNRRN
ncbi:MAG: Bax inhibitor-1/YccA family protein [Verrucomicrobiales bacterium]|nr:Bax inhibitor-1/YccA family protein [Verrucomicrobiales bacterium]